MDKLIRIDLYNVLDDSCYNVVEIPSKPINLVEIFDGIIKSKSVLPRRKANRVLRQLNGYREYILKQNGINIDITKARFEIVIPYKLRNAEITTEIMKLCPTFSNTFIFDKDVPVINSGVTISDRVEQEIY